MDDATSQPITKDEPATASELLSNLLGAFPRERITVGDIIEQLEDQAFGLLLLLLALPNCIPSIPGLSTVFGLMMIAPAVQLILGRDELWLPARMRSWSISRDALRVAIRGALPPLRAVERFFGPHWTVLTRPPFTRWLGLQTLLLAAVMILPIPLAHWLPGIAIATAALALLQRDGRLALLSLPLAVGGVVFAWAGVRIAYVATREIWRMLNGAYFGLF